MYNLTDEEIELLTTRAARKAVEEFSQSHTCRFTDKQMARICAFDRACDEYNVTDGDMQVMVYSAKTAHGFFQDLGKKMFYTIGIAIVLILAWIFGSETVHNLLKNHGSQ